MRITNLNSIPRPSTLDVDVCVIGAGPAGLTIATELANSRHSVLVLESGSLHRETDFAAALNNIESIGEPRVMEQRKVRNRVVGGSSLTWSGRCAPLDSIDYARREWVPSSGWPVSEAEMEPLLTRAAKYLGLMPLQYTDALLAGIRAPEEIAALCSEGLRSVYWQFSQSSSLNEDYVRFGPRFSKLKASNVRLLTNATAVDLVTSADGQRVTEIKVAAPTQTVHRVRSRYIILCGGGIENARLLLASRQQNPRGVGNDHDVVGRFLMDHPRATLGTFAPPSHPPIQEDLGLFRHPAGAVLQRGLSFSPAVQTRERLLNCVAWTTQHVAYDDAWRALRMLARRNGSDRVALGRVVLRYSDQIVEGLWSRYVRGRSMPRRMGRLDLDAMVEQAPDRNSRITLADRTDALGVPLAKLDWKIGRLERETAIQLGHAVNAALVKAGKPPATLVDWVRDRRPEDARFEDPAHPIGTTRMSECVRCGVVDPNSKVHGIDNLYIAGSSVFPSGGHANPTLMIVAMALRVADQLRRLDSAGTPP